MSHPTEESQGIDANGDLVDLGEQWCYTDRKGISFRLSWTINDFFGRLKCMTTHDYLSSTPFTIPHPKQNLEFEVQLHSNGSETENDVGGIFVYLVNRKGVVSIGQGTVSISVIKGDGSVWRKSVLPMNSNFSGRGIRPFKKSELREQSDTLLPGGKLTMRFHFKMFGQDTCIMSMKPKPPLRPNFAMKSVDILCSDLAMAFGDEKFSDVDLVCSEQVFKCHKIILASRSDVFDAMFSHRNTAESLKNKVEITDLDAETLEHLLRYIYTGNADEITSVAPRLLAAADKYNLQLLKEKCEESICKNIDVENASEILILAYLHERNQLKKMAITFVKKNIEEVMQTENWKTLIQSYPTLLTELIKVE